MEELCDKYPFMIDPSRRMPPSKEFLRGIPPYIRKNLERDGCDMESADSILRFVEGKDWRYFIGMSYVGEASLAVFCRWVRENG